MARFVFALALGLASPGCAPPFEGEAFAATRPPGDYGVILYLSGTPGSCTYVNPVGTTVPCTQIATSYVASASQVVTGYGSLGLDVHCDYTGTASITVKVEVKRTDSANPTLWGWEPALTILSDATGVPKTNWEQALTTASGTDVRLLTGDTRLSGTLRVSAKAATASAGAVVAIGLSTGGSVN